MALLEDLATYLTAQSQIGGASGWSHSVGFFPDAPDQLVGLFQFAGRFPLQGITLERPGVQIRVRAATYPAAQSKAYALFDVMNDAAPAAVTNVRYWHAVGSPFPLGQDGAQRPEFVLNYDVGVSR